jgi:Lon protease-like protein
MVLLPTEVVPLHIFEPRYRELIGECLEQDTSFGLVFADDQGLAPIGTYASVTHVLEQFEDGRLNIVIEGRDRFRLAALTEGRSFQTGEVEPFEDQPDPAEPSDVERALGLFKELATLTGSEVDEPDIAVAQLSFALAARFDLASDLKLELLQEVSERIRMRRLGELLEGAANAIEHQRDVAIRAQRNGKAHPPE